MFTGKLIQITEVEKVGNNETPKCDIIVEEVEGNYPQTACFSLFGDKCDFISAYKISDVITVQYNIKSREYNGKWYTNLSAWKMEKVGASDTSFDEEDEGLPFN